MDTSPEYVRMCDCEEIQGAWKVAEGDWCCVRADPEFELDEVVVLGYANWDPCHTQQSEEEGIRHFKQRRVFLPRQDQLQEMKGKPEQVTWLEVGVWFGHWCCARYNDNGGMGGWSMEQLWLAYVMHKKHNKHWNGEKWA